MLRVATLESALPSRTPRNFSGGGTGATLDFISSASYVKTGRETGPTPQAFLVEQAPGSTLRPHFHLEDQFQVIVSGSGNLGRHAVRALSVHYANRQTGYGPLAAGVQGLSYFTLRQVADAGAWHLPDFKDKLESGLPRFQVTSDPVAPADPQALGKRGVLSVEVMLEDANSGMGAWHLRLPPGMRTQADLPPGSGRFYVVTAGVLLLEGAAMPRLSVIFTSADESALPLSTGAEGAEVIAVQFPHRPLMRRSSLAQNARTTAALPAS